MSYAVDEDLIPGRPEGHIPRDGLAQTVLNMLRSTDLVVVEGDDGAGKTTLLAEITRTRADRAVVAFLRPQSRWSYDPDVVQLQLAQQFERFLGVQTEGVIDERRRRTIPLDASRKAGAEPIVVVIDGLDEIPAQDESYRRAILEALPVGMPKLKFILSAREVGLLSLPESWRYRTTVATGFSLEEATRYFAGTDVNQAQVAVIMKTCMNLPGRMAVLKRLMHRGEPVELLLAVAHEKTPTIFELEWNRTVRSDECKDLLALLTYSTSPLGDSDLARIGGVSTESVRATLGAVPFVELVPSGHYSYVSEPYRKFADGKLSQFRRRAQQRLIDDLLRAPNSPTTLRRLPAFLAAAGRNDEVLKYLSPDFFLDAIDRTESLFPLRESARVGLDAAMKEHRSDAAVRFALQGSLLQEIELVATRRAECSALTAIGDFDAAVQVAEGCRLLEDRFELLALVAKEQRVVKGAASPQLLEELQLLFRQLPESSMTDRTVEVAEDLIATLPELAVDLVASSANRRDPDPGVATKRKDYVLARLSLAAAAYSRGDSKDEAQERIRAGIVDTEIREATSTAALLVSSFSAASVMEAVGKTGDIRARIGLLKEWALLNPHSPETSKVIEFGLDLAVRTTEYVWNAREIRALLTGLPHITHQTALKSILERLDAVFGTIERAGPSVDVFRIQLFMATAHGKLDGEHKFCERLLDAYCRIDASNSITSSECCAALLSFLAEHDAKNAAEESLGLLSTAEQTLQNSIAGILKQTAQQEIVLRSTLRLLVRRRPELANQIISQLNTYSRKDRARLDLVRWLMRGSDAGEQLASAIGLIADIEDAHLCESAIIRAIDSLEFTSRKGPLPEQELKTLLLRASQLRSADDRCHATCSALVVAYQAKLDSGFAKGLEAELSRSWRSIDSTSDRIEKAYRIASAIGKSNPELARVYLREVSELQASCPIAVGALAEAYTIATQLAVASYSGLLGRHVDAPGDLRSLKDIISELPGEYERAVAWTDVCVRLWIAGRERDARAIVVEHVRPRYQALLEVDPGLRDFVLPSIAPALYIGNRTTADEELGTATWKVRDACLDGIISMLLEKSPRTEPYDGGARAAYDVSADDAVEICRLAAGIASDDMLYAVIEALCTVHQNPKLLTAPQKADLGRRLRALASTHFPWSRGVAHEGFKIISEAQIERMLSNKDRTVWEALTQRALNIPNHSDRAYVVGILGDCVPNKHSNLRSRLFQDAKGLVAGIDSIYERVEQYRFLALHVADSDRSLAKAILDQAVRDSANAKAADVEESVKRVVDQAFRFDPDWAPKLLEVLDDDPARIARKKRLKAQLDSLGAGQALLKTGSSCDNITNKDLLAAARRAVGALNANRAPTQHFDALQRYLQRAATMPTSESYDLLLFVIVNLRIRYSGSEDAAKLIRPVFDSTVRGAQLVGRMAGRGISTATYHKVQLSKPGDSAVYSEGDRQVAEVHLREWLRECAKDTLLISDPYFGPDDLQVLAWILEENPSLRVTVLTSLKKQMDAGATPSIEDHYRHVWYTRTSVSEPPETEVIVVGRVRDNQSPIHDRWWLSTGTGLRLGTSVNSVGEGRLSDISVMSAEEAAERLSRLVPFVNRVRDYDNEKLRYSLFSL